MPVAFCFSGRILLADYLPVTLRCAAALTRNGGLESSSRGCRTRGRSLLRERTANVSSGLASSTSMSPAPPITVSHPAHRRAPAIQPVQRSMSRSASSGTGRSRQISATVIPRSLPDAIAALPDQPRTARRDDPAVRRCNPNYYTTTTDDSEASTFGASAMSEVSSDFGRGPGI